MTTELVPGAFSKHAPVSIRHAESGPIRYSEAKKNEDSTVIEQAIGLLNQVHRLAGSLGGCLDASVQHLEDTVAVNGLTSGGSTLGTRRSGIMAAIEERQISADDDTHRLQQQVTDAEARLRHLKKQMLLNNRVIDQLVAYRLQSENGTQCG
ncbi:hypothetical protein cyc_06130 [Cyclospora cayetanensis]|uniref:Uncharacterized protein n=1 Tax=Cyclospora cayetanensis TaxID=88456 RepID=A0A1D3D070_9EIME|nr:hypothetical protein cyc_06130 [Cyclospora cayetanensis]